MNFMGILCVCQNMKVFKIKVYTNSMPQISTLQHFFLPYKNGTDIHSIGKNSVKIEQNGNFFSCQQMAFVLKLKLFKFNE